MGQNGMEIYTLQSRGEGFPMSFCSLRATSVASAAFLGMTKYSPVRMRLTRVLLSPTCKSSVATFEGRTPVSIPQAGRYPIISPQTAITTAPQASFTVLSLP